MFSRAIGAVALAGFILPALGGTAALAVQPTAGLYGLLQDITTVTPTPSTAACPDRVGETLGGFFKYPGADALGATAAGTIVSGSEMWQQICTFPITPAAGVTSWTGTEVCKFMPLAGSPAKPNVDITFDFSFTFIDANDFLAKKTESFPVSGGKCVEDRNLGFTRSGK